MCNWRASDPTSWGCFTPMFFTGFPGAQLGALVFKRGPPRQAIAEASELWCLALNDSQTRPFWDLRIGHASLFVP